MKFCKGSRCRSGWHAAEKRRKIAEIKALLAQVERLAEELG